MFWRCQNRPMVSLLYENGVQPGTRLTLHFIWRSANHMATAKPISGILFSNKLIIFLVMELGTVWLSVDRDPFRLKIRITLDHFDAVFNRVRNSVQKFDPLYDFWTLNFISFCEHSIFQLLNKTMFNVTFENWKNFIDINLRCLKMSTSGLV